MKRLLGLFLVLFSALLWAESRIVGPKITVTETDGSPKSRVDTLRFGNGQVSVTGSTAIITITGGGGGGGGSLGIYSGTTFVGAVTSITFSGSALGAIDLENSMATVTVHMPNQANLFGLSTTTVQDIKSTNTWSADQMIKRIRVNNVQPLSIFTASSLNDALICFGAVVSTQTCFGQRERDGKSRLVWDTQGYEAISARVNAALGMQGYIGFSTDSPRARLEVSTAAGGTGPILIVSSGTTKLFEVNGESITIAVPIYSSGSATPLGTGGGVSTETDPAFTAFLSTGQARIDAAYSGVLNIVSTNSAHFDQVSASTRVLQSQIFTIISTNAVEIVNLIKSTAATQTTKNLEIAVATAGLQTSIDSLTSGAADNMGTHIASQNVSMNGFSISTAVAVAIGTHTTSAAFLTISTSNGAPSRPLVAVATGSHRILEVNGSSVIVRASTLAVDGAMVASVFVASGTGAANLSNPINHINIGPDGAPILKVYTTSVTLPIQTTWYTGVAFPFAVGESTHLIVNATSSVNGRFFADGTYSTATSNAGYYHKFIPETFVFGSTPVLTGVREISTGTVSQQTHWVISFATASMTTPPHSLTFTDPVAVSFTGTTGTNGGVRSVTTNTLLNGITNLISSGERDLIIRAVRDGGNANSLDPSQSGSAIMHIGLGFLVQQ